MAEKNSHWQIFINFCTIVGLGSGVLAPHSILGQALFVISLIYIIWEYRYHVRQRPQMYLAVFLLGGLCISFAAWWFIVRDAAAREDVSKDEALPGISLNLTIRVIGQFGDQRHYILDYGKVDNSRLSLYVSPDKMLTFNFIDANDEQPYSLSIPLGGRDCPLDRFFALSLELGIRRDTSMMRILINGRQVRYLEIPHKVSLGKLDVRGGMIGANLAGQNGAAFDVGEFMIFSATLRDAQIAQVLQQFRSPQEQVRYVRFNGEQWMKIQEFGRKDAQQSDLGLAPKAFDTSESDRYMWLQDK